MISEKTWMKVLKISKSLKSHPSFPHGRDIFQEVTSWNLHFLRRFNWHADFLRRMKTSLQNKSRPLDPLSYMAQTLQPFPSWKWDWLQCRSPVSAALYGASQVIPLRWEWPGTQRNLIPLSLQSIKESWHCLGSHLPFHWANVGLFFLSEVIESSTAFQTIKQRGATLLIVQFNLLAAIHPQELLQALSFI